MGLLLIGISLLLPIETFILGYLSPIYSYNQKYIAHFRIGISLFQIMLILIGIALVLSPFIFKENKETICSPLFSPETRKLDSNTRPPLFFIIIGIGLFLRLVGLTQSLWYDEIFTYTNYISAGPAVILTNLYNPNNHIFYSLLSFFSITWFGFSEWALRLPALLFGVGGIYLIYHLGRRFYTINIGIISAIFLALLDCHLRYSQEARGYTTLIFFALASIILFSVCWEENRISQWAAWCMVNILGIHTHLSMLFIPLGQVLFIVLFKAHRERTYHNRLRRMGVSITIIGGICALLYSIPLPLIIGYYRSKRDALGMNMGKMIWNIILDFSPGERLEGLFFLGLFGIGLIQDILKNKKRVLFLMLPFLVFLLVAMLHRHVSYYCSRYCSFFLPIYILYIAIGVDSLSCFFQQRMGFKRFSPRVTLIVGVISLFIPSLVTVYRFPKQDFRSAAQYVTKHKQPKSQVIFWELGGAEFRFYYPKAHFTLRRSAPSPLPGETWVIYSYPDFKKNLPSLKRKNYHLQKVFRGSQPDHDLYIWKAMR
jgi:hypothetical protein